MINWDDNIVGDPGETTTKTFDLVPAGLEGAGRVYFTVEKGSGHRSRFKSLRAIRVSR